MYAIQCGRVGTAPVLRGRASWARCRGRLAPGIIWDALAERGFAVLSVSSGEGPRFVVEVIAGGRADADEAELLARRLFPNARAEVRAVTLVDAFGGPNPTD